ncbi:MAG: exodeoxyribonuclease III, partial [Phycisphaerales bacterium]|nr:exodeoxyribonuclease III [Phycisphaerales bacterium]
RLDRILDWLARRKPDVVCLQEIKCRDDAFPYEGFEAAGYHVAVHGQPSYNGVAILSRSPITDVRTGLGDELLDEQSRLISAEIDGVRVICVYIPNGADLSSDKYPYKLRWLDALEAQLERDHDPDGRLIVCGDTNILHRDADAYNPYYWHNTGIGNDAVRAHFDRLIDWGLGDLLATKHPEGGIYSWWDYRHLSFPQNHGMRIDHILATESMAERCATIFVDRDERKTAFLGKPSDHAPVIAQFN